MVSQVHAALTLENLLGSQIMGVLSLGTRVTPHYHYLATLFPLRLHIIRVQHRLSKKVLRSHL